MDIEMLYRHLYRITDITAARKQKRRLFGRWDQTFYYYY